MLNILISGAGCAGLTAAAFFAKAGHRVQVLERKDDISTAGGGLSIRAGAARVIHQNGLEAAVQAVSQVFNITRIVDAYNDDVLRMLPNPSSQPEYGCTRPDYQRAMYEAALGLGVLVRFGCTVAKVVDEPGAKPYLVLADGDTLQADVIVAADGVRSKLRPYILINDVEPVVAPTAYYAIRLPGDVLRSTPALASLHEGQDLMVYVGKDLYVVSRYTTKKDAWTALYGVVENAHGAALWEEHGDIRVARDFFRDASPVLRAALEATNECDRWQLSEVPPLPTWRSRTGRVVLLGDSAHGMQPNAAQGLSQSIEDAAALNYLLSIPALAKDVPRATQLWEQVRKPRVEIIQAFAARMTRLYMTGDTRMWKQGQAEADVLSKDVAPDAQARYGTPAFARWLYEHDVLAELQKHLIGQQLDVQTGASVAKL